MSHTKFARTVLVTTGLLAGVLVGGSALQQWRSGSDEPQLVGDDARIVVDGTRDRPVMLAGGEAQLRYYVPGRCLVLQPIGPSLATTPALFGSPKDAVKQAPAIQDVPADGEEVPWHSAVWPQGTRVIKDGDRFGVRLADGSTYWAGDAVDGAGGAWPDSEDGTPPTFGLPTDCVGAGMSQLVPDPSRPR